MTCDLKKQGGEGTFRLTFPGLSPPPTMSLVTSDCNRCGDNSEKKKVLCCAEWRVGVGSLLGGGSVWGEDRVLKCLANECAPRTQKIV